MCNLFNSFAHQNYQQQASHCDCLMLSVVGEMLMCLETVEGSKEKKERNIKNNNNRKKVMITTFLRCLKEPCGI
ncbi:CLUMA_CG019880, isoform A [Clunio marinus]|uniref:CLUMA_CG019880, isoform A n=1 Tax=Clunio marinus TaxID=568069 RepID=A0A1J1J292_9DIPT|nr:CLUMA_CG019880, isoform A [Clunio marinus]